MFWGEVGINYSTPRKKGEMEDIGKHLKLVHFVVQRKFHVYPSSDQDKYDDLVEIGNIGLVKARNTYKEIGKFSTYAVTCIINEINHYFKDQHRLKRQGITVSFDNFSIEDRSWEEVFEDQHDYYDDMSVMCDFKEFLKQLDEQEKFTLTCMATSIKRCEAEKKYKTTPTTYRRALNKIKEKWLAYA